MHRTTNVPVNYLCTGTFVHKLSTKHLCTNCWWIFWTSVCCPFVHKRLTNISDLCLLSVCAQTVDQYIGTKRKRKYNLNQDNNTLGKCKQLSQAESQTLVRYVGQQTVVRCFYFRAKNGISICCPNIGRPFAVQNFLLCTKESYLPRMV